MDATHGRPWVRHMASHVSTCMSLQDTWQAMCPLAWKVQVVQIGQFVEEGGGRRKRKEKGRKGEKGKGENKEEKKGKKNEKKERKRKEADGFFLSSLAFYRSKLV